MNMREKMALAVVCVKNADEDLMEDGFLTVDYTPSDTGWESFLPYVDAILDVLAEPSKKLVNVGIDAYEDAPGMRQEVSMKAGFTAMVRAIKEGE